MKNLKHTFIGADVSLGNKEQLTKLTCDDCISSNVCEFAFDLYNTDGDCLALK
jgi:hypothetical protein